MDDRDDKHLIISCVGQRALAVITPIYSLLNKLLPGSQNYMGTKITRELGKILRLFLSKRKRQNKLASYVLIGLNKGSVIPKQMIYILMNTRTY